MSTVFVSTTLPWSGSSVPSPTLYKVKFVDCFPTTLGEITLSYDSVSEIQQYDVTWAYQYYETDTTS